MFKKRFQNVIYSCDVFFFYNVRTISVMFDQFNVLKMY